MKITAFLFCLLTLTHAISLPRKQLAGLPSEFGMHRLPDPSVGALTEQGAFIYIDLVPSADRVDGSEWSTALIVDSSELFAFAIFSPLFDSLDFTLTNPSGQIVPMVGTNSFYPVGDEELPCQIYTLENPAVGSWVLSAQSKSGAILDTDALTPQGAVITFNQSPIKAWAHLMTYHLTTGDQVGLVARITTDSEIVEGVVPKAVPEVVFQAYMEVLTPAGTQLSVPMHDDGLHSDELANDGIYGGSIAASEVGTYTATATLKGKTAEGVEFMRTTEHVLPVVTNEIDFLGTAFMTTEESSHATIQFPVETPELPENSLFRAYAEIYGTDASGQEVAICWLSSMVNPTTVNSQLVVSLSLDLSWVVKAGAKAPFTAKNVYIQDAHVHIPLDTLDSVVITTTAAQNRKFSQLPTIADLEITREMRVGRYPAGFNLTRSNAAAPTLMMVHGYCSDGNPFEAQTGQFSDAVYYDNPKANMNNQDFAEEVAALAEANNMEAFSVIGHSQGGIIGLHLYNYYFTAMDKTEATGRKIQTLGTPFLGCTGAGSSANLIKIFGYGCGTNTDLTVDGSRLWLAGITAEARSQVYFYTTTYKTGNLFGDYCNMAVNMVLEWPNDGVTELEYSKLPKGNNMGNVEKWCHTSDMGYPAQYTDKSRNTQMNGFAAR